MDEKVRYSFLTDFYGGLLTDKQQEIFDMFVNEDNSLSEIAEITGMTRQGVFDSVEKSKKALDAYEQKLSLAQKFIEHKKRLSDIATALSLIDEKMSDDNNRKALKGIINELTEIIGDL